MLAVSTAFTWRVCAADLAAEGQALAVEVRMREPIEDSSVKAVLRVRDAGGRRREVPVTIATALTNGGWRVSYRAEASPTSGEELTVSRSGGERPEYRSRAGLGASGTPGEDRILAGAELMAPFAGSDFWLADLGLEFLFWPEQKRVADATINMRKGVACRVLDSANPQHGERGYARVRSWIGAENDGIIYAEAYDRDNKLLKIFEVGGVAKVNGRWELKEMKIRDLKRDTRTRLEFDLGSK